VSYDFRAAEAKWQARWNAEPPARFDLTNFDPERAFYNLVEFPYPSAEGLHVGHVYTYCGADSLGRYMTMNGRQVFQPMGWDSFGIHTENYALKIGQDPHVVTDRATANYRRQLERVGANWSWESELRTDDPAYYRWTQWIFLQLYRAGLAVRKESSVVWCPSCLTVLAFEQVEGGRCERCSMVVTSKTMPQWYLRITAYADELLDALDDLDWPPLSKQLQREWIGRSPGADVAFRIVGYPERSLTAFTTRVDTLFGVTYVAIAPEHELVDEFAASSANKDEILQYAAKVRQRVGADRLSSVGSEAVGVRTDVRVIHPLTGTEVPVLVANYVLADYGTGVVMGVPAHDRRDMNFATRLGLPITQVVVDLGADPMPAGAEVDLLETDGVLINSDRFTGMTSVDAREAIAAQLADTGQGGGRTQYRFHDWLVSRQRYWGSPIPIVYCENCGETPVAEKDLPVVLPKTENIRPTGSGMSPLAAAESFMHTTCPTCGGPAERETDVFDTFVESSWYFLRYPSYDVADAAWDPVQTRRMLPVDMYAGGREHATRHHLYARFVTRALHQLGLLDFPEPFMKLRLHGLIIKDGAKMSKSRGNVINPDEYIDRYGSDNMRAYLLFCGPWEEGGDFNDRSLNGVVRFNDRLTGYLEQGPPSGPGGVDMSRLDRAIHKIGKDIEALKFNTAIAELMSLSNWFRDDYAAMNNEEWDRTRRTFALLLAPLEPFLAEECTGSRGPAMIRRRWSRRRWTSRSRSTARCAGRSRSPVTPTRKPSSGWR
jgi:leucyl-tRNA synthetase